MTSAVDLKHIGLIVSAGAAVALRFFSDFSFATIQDQAARASLDLGRPTLAAYGALVLSTLGYELHRDWFNLSPQAPFEVSGLVVVLVGAYLVLRRAAGAQAAAAAVLSTTPFVPLLTILSACALVLLRAARTA
ncbi:MAG: hypothetical protein LC797_04180 [Chloroflexi bacterium]|nr:hypothetical protein [Chloroflexota bacterium]